MISYFSVPVFNDLVPYQSPMVTNFVFSTVTDSWNEIVVDVCQLKLVPLLKFWLS